MSIRQIIGLICLVILFTLYFKPGFVPIVQGNAIATFKVVEVVGILMSMIWLVSSFGLKISMIFKKRWVKLNIFSVMSFIILLFWSFLPIHGYGEGTRNQYSVIQNVALFIIYFGWFAVDLADKVYLLKTMELDTR